MTDRELMQQALETLMDAQLHNYALKHKETNELIAALRERLAQPQRTHWEGCEEVHPECKRPATREEKIVRPGVYEVPVAFITNGGKGELWWSRSVDENGNNNMDDIPLYTTPPRREWVGLTLEEIGLLTTGDGWAHLETPALALFARAIEAKLKEKNNG